VSAVSEAEAIDRALEVERAARGFDRRVTKVRKAVASFGSGETLIVNSHGLRVEYEETACSTHVMSLAEDGGDSQVGWDFESGRYLADLDFAAVGRRSAVRAVRLLGARRFDSIRHAPVVFENSVTAEFLGILGGMLSAEAVLKGRSPMAGRVGARIASSEIRIVDDGTRERVSGGQPVDDEGVAVGRHCLVEGGVLRGYMHNTYTAARSGTVSTGNAVRGGYASVPSVGPIVLVLEAEGGTVEAGRLVEGLDQGLHVVEVMGLHTVNAITGEFSVGVSGLWIERGRVVYPIREAVLSGTVMKLFEQVEALGDDLKFGAGIGAPSMLCGAMDISA
jgi:PmbA protein